MESSNIDPQILSPHSGYRNQALGTHKFQVQFKYLKLSIIILKQA